MQNGEYYWIKPKSTSWLVGVWTPGIVVEDVFFRVAGSVYQFAVGEFEIGPKVIGHDEPIAPLQFSAEAKEGLRDRFAMAALTGIMAAGSFYDMQTANVMELAYQRADEALAERSKVKS